MNLNHLLVWMVCASCLLLLVRILRSPRPYARGWLVVTLLVLSLTGGLMLQGSAIAGWVGGALWLGLIVIPSLGMAQVNRLTFQERYQAASRLAQVLSWLHPADGWQESPHLLWALALGQQGNLEAATQIIQRYQTRSSAIAQTATALLYRMGSQWQELLIWLQTHYGEQVLVQGNPVLAVHYLRALGETGDLNGLMQMVQRVQPLFERTGDGNSLSTVRLFALAFSGQTVLVQRLFAGPLAAYALTARQFWLATAELAAGQEASARQQLQQLQASGNATLRQAVDWRLSQPVVDPNQVLTDQSRQILDRIGLELHDEARYGGRMTGLKDRKAYATYGLIGLNFLVFGLASWLGGTEDIQTLYRLGALVPEAVWAGEWWRLGAATFLHFGWLHLLMNMVGLYFLGVFVEARLGVWKYLVAYFASGLGSMVVLTLMAALRATPGQIVVGASGAIMGLIGVIGAIFLYGWHREKSQIAARRLRTVLLIVGLQVVFDLTTPQVSFIGHTSGLLIGFLVGNLLLLNHRFPGIPTRDPG